MINQALHLLKVSEPHQSCTLQPCAIVNVKWKGACAVSTAWHSIAWLLGLVLGIDHSASSDHQLCILPRSSQYMVHIQEHGFPSLSALRYQHMLQTCLGA